MWLTDRCKGSGINRTMSFNGQFDHYLHDAIGQWLILAVVGGKSALPDELWSPQTLLAPGEIQGIASASGVLCRNRSDGTNVLVVFGKDDDALKAEIERVDLQRGCTNR